ncbi:MAG: hypothetical protein ACYC7A_20770 [Thermoanaerobaculia bacterium]
MRLVLVALSILVSSVASFTAGRATAHTSTKAVTLKEEMILLDSEGHPSGRIPRGTALYLRPDPLADRNTRFVLHVMTDVNDEGPLQPMTTDKTFVYSLKSHAWLAKTAK